MPKKLITYKYKYNSKPLATKFTAKRILEAKELGAKSVIVSLDLGFTESRVEILNDEVSISANKLPLSALKKIVDDDGVFIIEANQLVKIAFSSCGKYYKLKCIAENAAPTIEISGIHMHRIKEVTPWQDALMKVKAARIRPGLKVLDICTGLGYTSIASILRGAKSVLTIEKDENVLKIASYNPWSKKLQNEKIKIILGDAFEVIRELNSEYFDRIIHDPPRFSLAGNLYSREFYSEIYRVLRSGGILYHYTGQPGVRRRVSIIQGVSRRLREVGFSVKISRKTLGIIAFKD
ncbi:MAG: RsmD family RNA methyltransferase [archaeon GB-1867-005]|nr:RsmD family RNA methyltransferase [Candidatus Culexmicrobium cathedralense]